MDRIFSMLRPARAVSVMTALVALVMLAGCDNLHQDMGNQPKNKPLSPSDFFARWPLRAHAGGQYRGAWRIGQR